MKVLREMTQERGGLAKSLILKDAHDPVILLFVPVHNGRLKKWISQLLLRHTTRMDSSLSRIQKIFN